MHIELTLIGALLTFAIIDAVNPTTLVTTIFLLSKRSPVPMTLAFIAGTFFAYFTVGLLLFLGLEELIAGLAETYSWGNAVIYLLQFILGFVMLYLGFRTKIRQKNRGARLRNQNIISAVMLGTTVTLIDATTAAPYFAAVSILTAADVSFTAAILLLVMYNAVCVSFALALVAVRIILRHKAAAKFEIWRRRWSRLAQMFIKWALIILGVFLVIDAILFLLAEPLF
jgi:cytochrome c biogenesis protein CcdA